MRAMQDRIHATIEAERSGKVVEVKALLENTHTSEGVGDGVTSPQATDSSSAPGNGTESWRD
jgi:hypothetical protein